MMRWNFLPVPESAELEQLSSELNNPPALFVTLLWQRGIRSLEDAKVFLYPDEKLLEDPWTLKDMPLAVERLSKALQQKEKIWLLGDYDVDGTTAATLTYLALQSLGGNCEIHIPDRYTEGYGVSMQGIDRGVAWGANLMITLDCGIRSEIPLRYAALKGLEVIVCDHHIPGTSLPPAYAILDPRQEDCSYKNPHLTGCGVAFKLLWALYEHLGEDPKKLLEYIDLLALSISCDLVEVTGENRYLLAEGLKKINQNPLPGIKALLNLHTWEQPIEINDLLFFLGPRINAAGRISHGKYAVEILQGQALNLSELVVQLNEDNAARKLLDEQQTQSALAKINSDPAEKERMTTVLWDKDWVKGVLGISASRLIEQYYRPTILLAPSGEHWTGSARSVAGFDLFEALSACENDLLQFGGHKFAAGLTLREDQLENFKVNFEAIVRKQLTTESYDPELAIDAVVSLAMLSEGQIKQLKFLAPHGPGNLQPVFASKYITATQVKILKEKHIKFIAMQGETKIEAIGFGMAAYAELLHMPVDIAFHANIQVYRGQSKRQLQLKDIRPSQ